MNAYVKKNSPIFLNSEDEYQLAVEIRKGVPDLKFVDGSLWTDSIPPVKDWVSECESRVVYLWSPISCSILPSSRLESGKYRGPTSGIVIQLMRCQLLDGVLKSGDIGIGFLKSDTGIGEFVKIVWKALRKMNAAPLRSVHATTGITIKSSIADYVVGPGAVKLSNTGTLLKHCSAEVFYKTN